MTQMPPAADTATTAPAARQIWQIGGSDAVSLLQGLVSNDVLPLQKAPGLVWAALLNPQGKYLADFFLLRRAEDPASLLYLDIDSRLAPAVLRLLQMYKLRADVAITPAAMAVTRGTGAPPMAALPDPRHSGLGWRHYHPTDAAAPADDATDWDALRVALMVPEYPNELRVNDSYILEQGFERLHGVDFRKGCYVGQEVTARMKHKTELKKGLVRLQIQGEAAPGTPITLEDGREAGILGTTAAGMALAHMRHDRLNGPLLAGTARLSAESP